MISPTATVGKERLVLTSSFKLDLSLKLKNPKQKPSGKPTIRAKMIEMFELKSVVLMAEMTLSSALKSKFKASLYALNI